MQLVCPSWPNHHCNLIETDIFRGTAPQLYFAQKMEVLAKPLRFRQGGLGERALPVS